MGKGQPLKKGQSSPFDKGEQGRYREVSHTKACVMQDTNVYLELLHERGKKGLPLERVYRQLYNKKLYLTAYGKIYRNAGAMTPGVTEETVDSMSLEKVDTIIKALQYERYQWEPARRTYIPKRNGNKRPLGMPVWSDKLLAEVVRMILNAYYEPQFSDHSHGFRPGRGCHTALRDIYYHWTGTTWFIEGDIKACFDSFNHELLISALKERIHDGRFIQLIRKLLDAGYLEDWKYNQTLSGVPQGSILSPMLSNILLDKFVETVLIPQYSKGGKRKPNREYENLLHQAHRLFKKGQIDAAMEVRKQAQQLSSVDTGDPDHRRLKYVRYADDFCLGFVGPKAEAEEIKQQIGAFLQDELKLELSKTKTLITHARSEAARFLGYEVTTIQDDKKLHSNGKRNLNGRIGLKVPYDILQEKCKRYKKNGKVKHRAELINESDYTIISTYQLEFRGIANYYRLAYNMHTLNELRWIMALSLTKTLACKHKTTAGKIVKKHKAEQAIKGITYKVLQTTVKREGKKPLIATWGGISLKWDIKANLVDQLQRQPWNCRSELEKRLLAQVCEQCGVTHLTDKIEVHHIRALKDLNEYTGREKPLWVQNMAARRRKTLVLCRTCHMDIQYGRPVRRQKSSP
jgi:group II intron reverse transcriptase/maturase